MTKAKKSLGKSKVKQAKVKPFKFLNWLRFHTTFVLHLKAHKMGWYKEWHQWRLSHHFHLLMLAIYMFSIISASLTVFLSVKPQNALASTVYEWDMNNASEYAYNPSEIEFTGGVAQSTGYNSLDSDSKGIFCTNPNTCFVAGFGGIISKTVDGGANWISQNAGFSNLFDIACPDANTCYAPNANSRVYKTTDGGGSWNASWLGIDGLLLHTAYCTTADICVTAGVDGFIWRTTNGGATNWTPGQYVDGTVEKIYCPTSDICYAVGQQNYEFPPYSLSLLLKSEDGGINWNSQLSEYAVHLYDVHCSDANNCYTVGDNGVIYKTSNGGTNWISKTSGTSVLLEGVHCTDSDTCYVVSQSGMVLKTSNGGTTWSSQNVSSGFFDIHCPESQTCYAAGNQSHYKTINAGSSWIDIDYYPMSSVVPDTSQDYHIITGFKENLGSGSTGTIYYQVSNDDGVTWYWHDGSSWVTAASNDYRNTPTDINANIADFTGTYGSGTGKFKWKAIYYASSDTQLQKLDSIQIAIKGTSPNKPEDLTISDVSNRDKSVWALALSWDTPLPGGANIDYYKIERSDDGGAWQEVGTTNDGTKRAYAEVVASSAINYSYRVKAVDHDEIGGIYNDESEPSNVVSMTPTGKYTNPPNLIGTPGVAVTATSANITWSTDRVSSSTVKYGVDTSYGLVGSSHETEVTSHSVSLKGLLPGTTYHYKIQFLDPERTYGDDVYYDSDYTFTTSLTAAISNLKVTDIRANSALLSWQTTSDMSSTIHYGKTIAYGSTVSASAGTNHSVTLTGLSDLTTYHFRIIGNDVGGNLIESDDYSFETLAFPKISNLVFETVRDKPTSTLKVTWETNVPTSSVVEYISPSGQNQSISDYKLVTKHELIVSSLEEESEYIMNVRGRDGLGNEVSLISQKIKTDMDTRPPEISEITTETSIDGYGTSAKSQIIVSWSTDEPSTSQVQYSKGNPSKLEMVTQEDSQLATSHAVVVSGLQSSSSYYFRIVTKDNSKNEAISEIQSVLTDQIRLSIFDLIFKSFDSTLGWLFGAKSYK